MGSVYLVQLAKNHADDMLGPYSGLIQRIPTQQFASCSSLNVLLLSLCIDLAGMHRLSVSKDKAMELANLVLLALDMYEEFKAETSLKDENEWRFAQELHGSHSGSFDYKNPKYPLTTKPIEYEVLAEFWHSDKPVGKLDLETVPFGFIARKVKGNYLETDEVYIVFRGTLNSQEWAENTRFKKENVVKGVPGAGYVHRGFNSIFESSYEDRLKTPRGLFASLKRRVLQVELPIEERRRSMRETLETVIFDSELVHPNAKIFITGHSLGGALALLAGRVIANKGRQAASQQGLRNSYNENLAICTFAAPRVGDESFKKVFDEINVVRYVNTEDIVPTVPPATSVLLGSDMKLTPEGLREYKKSGVKSIANIYKATAGSVQGDGGANGHTPFTHVGKTRAFTITQDSISFNHNLVKTYREGIDLYHRESSAN